MLVAISLDGAEFMVGYDPDKREVEDVRLRGLNARGEPYPDLKIFLPEGVVTTISDFIEGEHYVS